MHEGRIKVKLSAPRGEQKAGKQAGTIDGHDRAGRVKVWGCSHELSAQEGYNRMYVSLTSSEPFKSWKQG